MINVTKSFYPVGQGGFYSERILFNGTPSTFVYDCGALNTPSNTKKSATAELSKSINRSGIDSVDFIVISHLDEDHINGIVELEKYLLNTNKPLPLIFIPRPTPFDLLLFFRKTSESSPSLGWLLQTLYFNKENRVVFIDAENDDICSGDYVLQDGSLGIGKMLAGKFFSHKKKFSFFRQSDKKAFWMLKFFVDQGKFCHLKRDEVETIESIKTITDFKKKIKRIKGIYRKVRFGMNGSSMSMISFPQANCDEKSSINFKESYITWLNGDACLKTEAKMMAMEEHFSEVFNCNVDFQIPHHGSHRSFGRFPQKIGKVRTYIWAGFENRYGHPSGTVLNMVKIRGYECNWITERTSMPIVRHETWFI